MISVHFQGKPFNITVIQVYAPTSKTSNAEEAEAEQFYEDLQDLLELTPKKRPFTYDLNKIPYEYTVEVMNEFKRLYLIDRVPEELWTEVHAIVQEAVIKTIPKKRNAKRQNAKKWLSEEALQIAEKRREEKGKGEKERYTHLNAQFQRIAKKDKKAFLSE